MPVRVHHSGARAVRAAVEINPRVAEEPADVIQVVHGDRGCVLADVGFGLVAGETGAESFETLVEILIELLLVVLAIERARVARAALIHQHDIPIGLEVTKHFTDGARHFGGTLARSARKKKARMGAGSRRRPGRTTILSASWRPACAERSSRTSIVPQ